MYKTNFFVVALFLFAQLSVHAADRVVINSLSTLPSQAQAARIKNIEIKSSFFDTPNLEASIQPLLARCSELQSIALVAPIHKLGALASILHVIAGLPDCSAVGITLDSMRAGQALQDTGAVASFVQGLAAFTKVTSLGISLQQAVLTADAITGIIQGLASLTKLQQLSLSFERTALTVEHAIGLVAACRAMPSLHRLDLNCSYCFANEALVEAWAESLSSLQRLSVFNIDLEGNNIHHQGFTAVHEMGATLRSLQSFSVNVGNNKGIAPKALKSIGKLGLNPSLKQYHLYCWENDVDQKAAEHLATGLSCLHNLERLGVDLSYNKLGEKGVGVLAREIGKLDRLSRCALDLSDNEFTAGAVIGLSNLTQLKELELEINQNLLAPEGLRSIARVLAAMPSLESLNLVLTSEFFSNDSIAALAKSLCNKPSLRNIKIGFMHSASIDESCLAGLKKLITNLPENLTIELGFWGNTMLSAQNFNDLVETARTCLLKGKIIYCQAYEAVHCLI